MTTAYTSLLGLALPVTGELSGTWGDVVNQSITSLLDTSVAGTTNVSTDANVTLTTTTGASNQARQAILLFSGARTAIRTVTAPAQSKIYTVINATTGGFAVQLVGAGPTTGVTIANGARTVVAWNGSDFVEVSSPSSIILPGGTANGVLYLNGSKVVTSGSALVFDGTNLGVANSSPSDAVTVGTTTTGKNIRIYSSSNGNNGLLRMFDSGNTERLQLSVNTTGEAVYYSPTSSVHAWYINTEQMRLTSTGLGIGTSSPSSKLHVVKTGDNSRISIGDTAASTYSTLLMYGGSGKYNFQLGVQNNVNNAFEITPSTAVNGTTFSTPAFVLDSSGNLGLGVTPSAWVSGRNCVEIGGSIQPSIAFNGSTVANGGGIWTNGFNNGTNNVYKANGTASRLDTGSGGFSFYLAPSGTAGNAITFTQAMTLASDGVLLVGRTITPSTAGVKAALESSGDTALQITKTGVVAGRVMAVTTGLAFGVDLSDGATERCRIDSSGNFLVGITASSGTPANGVTMVNTTGASAVCIGHSNGTGGGNSYMNFAYNAGAIGSITQSGTTAVLYNTTSDQRLKENIQDADSASSLIDALQVRKFDWKSDNSHQRYGFVAQELVTVAPEAVYQPEDTEAMMAVDYSKLVPMLVKEIQSLRQRVAQLESN